MNTENIKKQIKKTAIHIPDNIQELHDSMQLDSNQELIHLDTTFKDLKIEVSVMVYGRVKVIFRDSLYKAASQMPQELIECYKNGDDPETLALSDGRQYETPYICDENNWLEEIITVRDKDNKTADESCEVIDVPDDNSREGWEQSIIQDIVNLICQDNEDSL